MFWILSKWFGTCWIFFEVLILFFGMNWFFLWNDLECFGFSGMICFFWMIWICLEWCFFNYLFLEWFVFWWIICNDLDFGTFGLVFLWIFPGCIVFWLICLFFVESFWLFRKFVGHVLGCVLEVFPSFKMLR